jgi:hypothetical protein
MSVTRDGNGEGRRWGATVFGGEEGEEARRFHGAEGGQQNKERHDGKRLKVEDDKKIRSVGWIYDWAELLTKPSKKYGWEYDMDQKDMRMNTDVLKRKRKSKSKTRKDFWLLKIENLIK